MWILLIIITLFSFLYIKLIEHDCGYLGKNFIEVFKAIHLANNLYLQIVDLDTQILKGKTNFELSEYKFFTGLINTLLESAKLHGTGIREYLPEIKKALVSDIRFEKKIKNELLGGVFQMITVQCFGIVFVYFYHTQLTKAFEFDDYILTIALAGTGFFLYFLGFIFLKHRTFSKLAKYFKSFYKTRILLFARVPISKIHKSANIEELPGDKELQPLKFRALNTLVNLKSTGELCRDDMDIIIEELWFAGEFKFETFVKHLAALRLFIIVFFFLSGFMLTLIQSLETLAV
jgi:hypothetical protein